MDKKYTAKELDLLHAELYDILGETIRICRKHDIPYFVIGGTAIGALYDRAIPQLRFFCKNYLPLKNRQARA